MIDHGRAILEGCGDLPHGRGGMMPDTEEMVLHGEVSATDDDVVDALVADEIARAERDAWEQERQDASDEQADARRTLTLLLVFVGVVWVGGVLALIAALALAPRPIYVGDHVNDERTMVVDVCLAIAALTLGAVVVLAAVWYTRWRPLAKSGTELPTATKGTSSADLDSLRTYASQLKERRWYSGTSA